MTKIKFSLSSTAFITIVSAYFSFMLNIKFWQFAFEKIEISNFMVLIFTLSLPFFILILAGGLLYTIGTYFYGHPQRKFNHFIWHIFILLASICHLAAILYFMI